jgi:hypothetical protein
MIIPEAPVLKNGVYAEKDSVYYYVDDQLTYAGLIYMDENTPFTAADGTVSSMEPGYYYVKGTGELIHGRSYWITKTNDIEGFKEGAYNFDEKGKLVLPDAPQVKNGIYEENDSLFYYVDGARNYAGLIKIDGDYYYVRQTGELVHGTDYWVTKHNNLVPAGRYSFDEDGKMILSGNVPILLNGERAELLVSMVYAYHSGEEESITVTGVRYVYDNGEENKDDFDTERDPLLAVAKDAELTAAGEDAETASRIDPETGEIQKADAVLREADEIIFLCDRYDKNGEATGIHEIVDADGSPIRVTYNGKLELSYKEIDESRKVVATYCFTDIYSNEHWTAPMD